MRWRKKTPRAERGYSLRRRLIGTTLGSSILVGLVSTVIVLAIARKEVNDAYDDWLEEGARLVLALGEGSIGRAEFVATVDSILQEMQDGLLARAKAFRAHHGKSPSEFRRRDSLS